MYDQQHFVDLRENPGLGDPNSWLSGDGSSSPIRYGNQPPTTHSGIKSGANGNVDRSLYKDLVEIVPLVQSLIDRKASNSFTRRGSVVYTKTPSRESLSKKITETKGRNASQSIPVKKKKDQEDKDQGITASDERSSRTSSRTVEAEKDWEELVALRGQVEDLQKKLSEKDELLKSSEISKNDVAAAHAKLDELKLQAAEKDSLLKSAQRQLSDAKIKLADRQAALEKLQWEASQSNLKVEKLQEELNSMRGEMLSFMQLFEGLGNGSSTSYTDSYDIAPYEFESLPYIDELDEKEMRKLEEASEACISAVAMAKEKQDEYSVGIAVNERLRLQSLIFRTYSDDAADGNSVINS